MPAKPWPADGKTASFEDITAPLRDLLEQAYTLERKPLQDLDYNGLDRGAKHILLEVDDALTAEQLRYDDEDQGRDALEVILGLAVQLGIEQGRRIVKEELSTWFLGLETWEQLTDIDPKLAARHLAEALETIRERLPKDENPR